MLRTIPTSTRTVHFHAGRAVLALGILVTLVCGGLASVGYLLTSLDDNPDVAMYAELVLMVYAVPTIGVGFPIALGGWLAVAQEPEPRRGYLRAVIVGSGAVIPVVAVPLLLGAWSSGLLVLLIVLIELLLATLVAIAAGTEWS